jgi:hypothetical protein
MRCPRCDADNPEGMKFCIECAAPLTRRCPQCGFVNPPQAKFCGQCATALTGQTPTPHPSSAARPPLSYTPGHLAEKILTARAALEGERKHVTVLFADLKGSMELLADRDPEEARQLLDPVLERMMAAVHRYEGIVNQVMGDGIMALFGAPLAHEDHAVRACYTALHMQDAVGHYAAELRQRQGLDVQIRVGLNSGEMASCIRIVDFKYRGFAVRPSFVLRCRSSPRGCGTAPLLPMLQCTLSAYLAHSRPCTPLSARTQRQHKGGCVASTLSLRSPGPETGRSVGRLALRPWADPPPVGIPAPPTPQRLVAPAADNPP